MPAADDMIFVRFLAVPFPRMKIRRDFPGFLNYDIIRQALIHCIREFFRRDRRFRIENAQIAFRMHARIRAAYAFHFDVFSG